MGGGGCRGGYIVGGGGVSEAYAAAPTPTVAVKSIAADGVLTAGEAGTIVVAFEVDDKSIGGFGFKAGKAPSDLLSAILTDVNANPVSGKDYTYSYEIPINKTTTAEFSVTVGGGDLEYTGNWSEDVTNYATQLLTQEACEDETVPAGEWTDGTGCAATSDNTDEEGVWTYAVEGTITVSGTKTQKFEPVPKGTVVNLFEGATVTVTKSGGYVYTGSPIAVQASEITVTLQGQSTALPRVGNWNWRAVGTNAGTDALVVMITGINSYAGASATGRATIAKREMTLADFVTTPSITLTRGGEMTPAQANANGGVTARLAGNFTGGGAVTIEYAEYDEDEVTPDDHGIEGKAPYATYWTFLDPADDSEAAKTDDFEDKTSGTGSSGSGLGTKYDVYVTFDETGTNFTGLTKRKIGTFLVKTPPTGLLPTSAFTFADVEKTITYGDTLVIKKPTVITPKTDGTLGELRWVIRDKNDTWKTDTIVKGTATANAAKTWLEGDLKLIYNFEYDLAPYTVIGICSTWVGGKVANAKVQVGEVKTTVKVNKRVLDTTNVVIKGTYTYQGSPLNPEYSVVRKGTTVVIPEDEYDNETNPVTMLTQAGTNAGMIKLVGKKNYTGTVEKKFTILPAPLTLGAWTVGSKEYDGTKEAKAELFTPVWIGIQQVGGVDEVLEPDVDFKVENGEFAQANATVDPVTVTGKVTLVTGGPVSKNYSLSATAGQLTLSNAGTITKTQLAEPDLFFNYKIPTDVFVKTTAQPLAAVTYKGTVTNAPGVFTLIYNYTGTNEELLPGKPSAQSYPVALPTAPIYRGTYEVRLAFTAGPNFDADTIVLGNYVINAPLPPVFVGDAEGIPANVSVQEKVGGTLKVTVTAPNEGKLTYQWYSSTDALGAGRKIIAGETSSSYEIGGKEGDEYFYDVVVKMTSSKQIDTSITSRIAKVTVTAPPIFLTPSNSAMYLITDEDDEGYVYTGDSIKPAGTKVEVYYKFISPIDDEPDSTKLVEGTDFEFVYDKNVNAGPNANITIEFLADSDGQYKYYGSGPAAVKFEIKKATLTDNNFTDYVKIGTGSREWGRDVSNVGADVKTQSGVTGLGAITTAYYDGDEKITGIPANVGRYGVYISTAAGDNFNATANLFLGMYRITKRLADTADLDYKAFAARVEYTGEPIGIGEVKIKAALTGYGEIVVTYNDAEDPPIEPGTYTVKVSIGEGTNFAGHEVELGSFEIYDKTGVAESTRDVKPVVKAPVDQVVKIDPVKVVAKAAFTAGPVPVSKSGAISFFYAKSVKSGKLFIYSQSGKLVKKVAVSAVSGKVATWDLSGSGVAEGVYVAKGVLTAKDGTKEKVSVVFSVVK